MKRITIALIIIVLVWVGVFYWKNLRGILPALQDPVDDITEIIDSFRDPFSLPPEVSISIFASDLPGVRVMRFDSRGNMWVSQTSEGKITRLEIQNGSVISAQTAFEGLRKPHGLAFDPNNPLVLYIAQEHELTKTLGLSPASKRPFDTLAQFPSGDGHFTRTVDVGPDGRLYVSIGSSCNVCVEDDDKRATIISLNTDGSDVKEFASGLRNAVFFTWHPSDERMWTTEMGRDLLGDDLPPDEINIVEEGNNYGWPRCFGKNVRDTNFTDIPVARTDCQEPFFTPSFIDIPAHSAPLGLGFIPEQGWPKEYWHDLIVAYHGSWNRSEPTGYKLVRFPLDKNGNRQGEAQDFIVGWFTDKGVLGRPVDILIASDGVMYISDDKAGVIYKVTVDQQGTAPIPVSEPSMPENGQASGDCIITGCSSHICASQELLSTCEFRPEYACYKNATCEPQEDGECGWTQTQELLTCINGDS